MHFGRWGFNPQGSVGYVNYKMLLNVSQNLFNLGSFTDFSMWLMTESINCVKVSKTKCSKQAPVLSTWKLGTYNVYYKMVSNIVNLK